MSQDFTIFQKPSFQIDYVPIDSRERISRWGGSRRTNSVLNREFTIEEIETIIRSGEISAIRELSRYYYRINGRYRNSINFLASLFLYDTLVTPIYESGKGSKAQITKAFFNACNFVETLDVKTTLARITREWLKTGIYYGIIQERGNKIIIQDLPVDYCRTRYKDFNNLNILEFDVTYFLTKYEDEKMRDAAIQNYPPAIQKGWKDYKAKKLPDPWVKVKPSAGGVVFCFAEDSTPLLIAAIPELAKLKDAVGREEKRDENELYKLLINKMPSDPEGHLVYELEEIEQIHAGISNMLRDLDTVDVLTVLGDATLENLQDTSAASQANNRIEKYSDNAWDALGSSKLFYNADNSSSLAYVVKRLESIMQDYMNVYSSWIRFLINQRFSRTGLTFNFEILPTTKFNVKDYKDYYLSMAQFGYPRMRAAASIGISQRDFMCALDFENEFLNLDEKMVPLMSSYTQTGDDDKKSGKKNKKTEKNKSGNSQPKDITNKGGRPELADEEKSQKTRANIDSKS